MPNCRATLLPTLLIPLLLGAASSPAGETPQGFVQAIYDHYLGKNAKGVPLDSAGDRQRYFAPPLAGLLDQDAKRSARTHEVGNLDGDPFVDAQDWQVEGLHQEVKETGAGQATATVTFRNAGQPTVIRLELVKLKSGWRISEVHLHDGDLSALLKGPPAKTKSPTPP